jgi:hypothetical protein
VFPDGIILVGVDLNDRNGMAGRAEMRVVVRE